MGVGVHPETDSRDAGRFEEAGSGAKAQIQEMHEEAKVQHLMTFIDSFDSPERIAIRRSLAEKRVDQRSKRLKKLDPDDIPTEFDDELDFCEDIGLLTARGYLNVHDVWNEFGQWIFYLYTDSHDYLESIQDSDYKNCRELEEKIRPIEISEGGGAYNNPSEQELVDYYMSAIAEGAGQPPSRSRRPTH